MTNIELQAIAADCTGDANIDILEFLNKYVQALTYGTSGAVVYINNSFDYKKGEPISHILHAEKIIADKFIKLVGTDDYSDFRCYVAQYIDIEFLTHVFAFNHYKTVSTINRENNLKTDIAAASDPAHNNVKDYKKISANVSYPTDIET
jgi:hypothetical protein